MVYKDLSYSLLRSFCEAARLGSLSAAAKSLDLSHPTVWKQIKALEKLVDRSLIQSDGRKSELTDEGKLLAELAAPVVAEFDSLPSRFQELCGTTSKVLAIAAPPRSFTDDLMPIIEDFQSLHPEVKLKLREVFEHQGDELLWNGEVDLVIGDRHCCQHPENFDVEPLYEIQPMVIMPVDHPLAKKKTIRIEDIAKYPVLNHPDNYPDVESRAVLQNAGVFDHPDRRFDLALAASIRACVKRGYGIGLVGRLAANTPTDPEICERSLAHCLRPVTCFGYRLRRVTENRTQRAFINLLKFQFGHGVENDE
ncbi:LysR family transcriptional regulator [Planctomicrobium sp. SH668]|uniref:LysR family transcriptional regulator n=1 Tax=Planctomicrobium sp. SH668 TaxID=3448126 RepID=UPI003F5BF8C4